MHIGTRSCRKIRAFSLGVEIVNGGTVRDVYVLLLVGSYNLIRRDLESLAYSANDQTHAVSVTFSYDAVTERLGTRLQSVINMGSNPISVFLF